MSCLNRMLGTGLAIYSKSLDGKTKINDIGNSVLMTRVNKCFQIICTSY